MPHHDGLGPHERRDVRDVELAVGTGEDDDAESGDP
jgi:hypothetical protein